MDEEIWRDRILSNKSRLCDRTSLSIRFLDKCVERFVLTRDERNDIESTRLEYDKKSRFYNTMLRKDETKYEDMVNIMVETETKQSDDVLNILTCGSSRQIETTVSSLELSSPIRRPGVWFEVVQPLTDVIGRDDTLNDLHRLVTRNAGNEKNVPITSQLTCVWGLGGVGKTTLVRKYAWDYCDYFDGNVIWIKAEDEQKVQNSFEKLASSEKVNIQLEAWNYHEANMMKIFIFFSNRKSLFVFDNVEKYGGVVDKFLPLSLGPNINKPYFLMTSRKEGLDLKIEDFKLGIPSFEDMTQLMTTKLKLQTEEDIAIAHKIVVQLEGLPLAVQQAISYIQNLEKRKQRFGGIINPIDKYCTLLQDNSEIQNILDSETADDYGKTVLRTWTTTIKTISKYETYGSSAEGIMNILAYFNPDSIKCDILESIYSKQIVEKTLTLLAEYSMIEVNEGFISIHRLVQQVIRIQNKSIEPELLEKCLEILMKRSDTLEHSYTIWKSALSYNDLVRDYPRVGIRLCENVHFGSIDSTSIFQDTSNKFNEVFGADGICTIELMCIKIISLCHDMSEPVHSLILQLSADLIGRLRISTILASFCDILPTLHRLAGALMKIGKSPVCLGTKKYEIIIQSLKHYERIQEVEKLKSYPSENAQCGIVECCRILYNIPDIRRYYLSELHGRLVSKESESDSNSVIKIIGPSGVGKTKLVLKYIQNYADYYDGVIWINAKTMESMQLSILKISGDFGINFNERFRGINLSSAKTYYGSRTSEEVELELLDRIKKLGKRKYLFVFRRSVGTRKIEFGDTEFDGYHLLHIFKVLLDKDFLILDLLSKEIPKVHN